MDDMMNVVYWHLKDLENDEVSFRKMDLAIGRVVREIKKYEKLSEWVEK